MNFSEWAKKIYEEEDFGRSISATLSGFIGLAIYLSSKDWGLSLFVTVIVFLCCGLLLRLHTHAGRKPKNSNFRRRRRRKDLRTSALKRERF